jgi:hypothetical protein
MEKLDKLADGHEFNIGPTFERLALDNILTTSLGVNKHIQAKEDTKILDVVSE